MATKRAKSDEQAGEEVVQLGRVRKMRVSNLRCIGPEPVEIDLDNIVVLVGPNNTGKSTILRAYEIVMTNGQLTEADLPQGRPDAVPCIELETYVTDASGVPDHWHNTDPETGEHYCRERWLGAPGSTALTRQGWLPGEGTWGEKKPLGFDNVAKSFRPVPYRLGAFQSPEEQTSKVVDILRDHIVEQIKGPSDRSPGASPDVTGSAAAPNPAADLEKAWKTFLERVGMRAKREVAQIERDLGKLLTDIVGPHAVSLQPRLAENPKWETVILPSKGYGELLVGTGGGPLTPSETQGSGTRRALMWAALKLRAERAPRANTLKYVSLIDEPEICLHPNAVREACRVLYDLAEDDSSPWQVMVTTHSPVFIDLHRDNTTVVRVERSATGAIKGTTLHRPSRARLSDDDRKELKLLNMCDPYVAEFFFGGTTIVVEGDTEYSAFQKVIGEHPDEFGDIHVVRARGKATIVALCKILNQFNAPYAVLHDSDRPLTRDGKKNGAWRVNEEILSEMQACACEAQDGNCTRAEVGTCSKAGGACPRQMYPVAALCNFESAFLAGEVEKDKPYNAVSSMAGASALYQNVMQLLRALVHGSSELPANAIRWQSLGELEAALPPDPADSGEGTPEEEPTG